MLCLCYFLCVGLFRANFSLILLISQSMKEYQLICRIQRGEAKLAEFQIYFFGRKEREIIITRYSVGLLFCVL